MKKILIGMPSYGGMIPSQTVQSLLQLHKPFPCAFMIVERQRIDKARNNIAMEALQQGFDYLLFIDDDNPIPVDTLDILIEDDKDIVSAIIPGRVPNKEGIHPLCCFYTSEIKVAGKPLRLYHNVTSFKDEPPLHKVDAVGTGCLLIKAKVLQELNKKYQDHIFEFGDIRFKEKITHNGKEYDRRTMSEDCEFSERAIDAGFEIYVDSRVRPYHLTTMNAVRYGNGGIGG